MPAASIWSSPVERTQDGVPVTSCFEKRWCGLPAKTLTRQVAAASRWSSCRLLANFDERPSRHWKGAADMDFGLRWQQRPKHSSRSDRGSWCECSRHSLDRNRDENIAARRRIPGA